MSRKRRSIAEKLNDFRFTREELDIEAAKITADSADRVEHILTVEENVERGEAMGFLHVTFNGCESILENGQKTLDRMMRIQYPSDEFNRLFQEESQLSDETRDGHHVTLYVYRRIAKFVYERSYVRCQKKEALGEIFKNKKFYLDTAEDQDPIRYTEKFYSALENQLRIQQSPYVVLPYNLQIDGEVGSVMDLSSVHTPAQHHPDLKDCPGISCAYTYIGSRHSVSENHFEDVSLQSVSVVVAGDAKAWTIFKGRDAAAVSKIMQEAVSAAKGTFVENCVSQHRKFFFHPQLWRDNNISFKLAVCRAGEGIITSYNSLHTVLNTGINLAKALNVVGEEYCRNFTATETIQCFCNARPDKASTITIPKHELVTFSRYMRRCSKTLKGGTRKRRFLRAKRMLPNALDARCSTTDCQHSEGVTLNGNILSTMPDSASNEDGGGTDLPNHTTISLDFVPISEPTQPQADREHIDDMNDDHTSQSAPCDDQREVHDECMGEGEEVHDGVPRGHGDTTNESQSNGGCQFNTYTRHTLVKSTSYKTEQVWFTAGTGSSSPSSSFGQLSRLVKVEGTKDSLKDKIDMSIITGQCQMCHKFFDKKIMVAHVALHCSDKKRHACPKQECNKTFSTLANLKAHEKSAHDSFRFACTDCDKQYTSSSTLREHVRKKHCSTAVVAVVEK